MNIRHLAAGAAIVFGALAAGTGVASAVPVPTIPSPKIPTPAIPSVSYVPKDNPATPINEAGTIQTTINHDQANQAAWMLSPLNPVSPISQQITQNNINNDCLSINSSSPWNHFFTPFKIGPDGLCNQAVG